MQPVVPIDTIPQILEPIKQVVSLPQFVQIERLVRGIILVEAQLTLEAIRRALVERISKGSLNHFLAESRWSTQVVHREVLTVLESNRYVAPRASGLVFADDTLTGAWYA